MSAVTIIIPRATARAEALAEDIGKLQEAESILAEKLKKVRDAKTTQTKELQAWMLAERAPLDIPVNLGPGRTATIYEKEVKGSMSVAFLTEKLIEKFGETEGNKLVGWLYDSRPSEIETAIKFTDVIKQAEAKKRRAEDAKLNPKPKKVTKKKAAATASSSAGAGGEDDYYEDE